MGGTSKKRRGTYAVYPRNHPRSVRWKVDYDYIDQLSPDEKEWLARFTDEYTGADFRGTPNLHQTAEQRRERYNAKNMANRGVAAATELQQLGDNGAYRDRDLTKRLGRSLITEHRSVAREIPALPFDTAPTPSYQAYPAYQAALAEFRALLDAKPRDEKALNKVRSKLERISRIHDPDESDDDQDESDHDTDCRREAGRRKRKR
jgi:hypothetical protein